MKGIYIVAALTVLGLVLFAVLIKAFETPDMPKKAMLAAMGFGLFYSGFSLAFTLLADSMLSGGVDDFFTGGAQAFTFMVLAGNTVIGAFVLVCHFKMSVTKAAFVLVFTYCATAGFFTFCFSIVLLSFLGCLLYTIMNITIICLRSSWHKQELPELNDVGGPSAGDHPAVAQGVMASNHSSTVIAIVAFVLRQFFGAFTGLINFVMQVGLLSFTVGDLQGLRHQVKEHFMWTFDFTLRVPELPSECGWVMAQATEASVVLNDAAEEVGQFLLAYSNLWTPNSITAYSSVGVFEITVVAAVFTIVLSDCLLILAPREGSGEIAKNVVELAARVFLYVVQVLVSVSHALLFALAFVEGHEIERPELTESQQFFHDASESTSTRVTNVYVGLVLVCALYVLLKLWSGSDGGLQNIASSLLISRGVDVEMLNAGKPCPMGFVCAFFGVWPESVKIALEVEERCLNFRLEQQEVLLATVNALSFPIYIVPFGAVVAKFGEYMNQCPIYVAGRDFHWADVVLSLTYAVEYFLVLFTCRELLDSAEQGYPTGEDAVANADDEWVWSISVCWLCLTLLRALATGIRDYFPGSPQPADPADPVKQGSGSLDVVSCQSSEGNPEKQGSGSITSCQLNRVAENQGTDSLGVISCQSSKVADTSQDVKQIEPTTSEV
jgi:hypothetical protein